MTKNKNSNYHGWIEDLLPLYYRFLVIIGFFKVYYGSNSNRLQVRIAVKMILRMYEKEVKIRVNESKYKILLSKSR